VQVPLAQTVPPVQFIPPHCPYSGTVPTTAVVLVLTALVVVLIFVLVVVLIFTLVVIVEVVAEEAAPEEGDEPLIEHPIRLELTATSSYQKVLASPPYDSQPK
jgi:heme/copper-type cytochrome/quinol oxidase subunit 2